MKTSLSAFALILTLLGQSRQNEFLEVDLQFENDILKSLSSHLVSNIPTQITQVNDHTVQVPQITENPITIQIPIVQNPLPTQIVQNIQPPQIFTLPIIPLQQDIPSINVPKQQKENGFKGCMIVPITSTTSVEQMQTTTTNVIHVTNTIVKTVKVLIPEVKKKRKAKKVKKLKSPEIKLKFEPKTKTEKIKETTEVISVAVVTPTVKISLQEERETDIDVNDIWKILESESKPKKVVEKIKKSPKVEGKMKKAKAKTNETDALKQRLKKLEEKLLEKGKMPKQKSVNEKKEKIKSRAMLINDDPIKKEIKAIADDKPACKGPLNVYEKVKHDLMKNDKKFHTLPAKKKKGSCLMEQTVIIPASRIAGPKILPPLISNIVQSIRPAGNITSDKLFYNCITNYAGTATKTVTSVTIFPVPTTQLSVTTETVYTRATELLTEVLYTPYTVTTTSTNTMYMIKVTTVNGAGCKNCELDSNGMVLPAAQIPPGIFATPINEVDPNKYDIVGYAGMNPPNFNPHLQGFQERNNVINK